MAYPQYRERKNKQVDLFDSSTITKDIALKQFKVLNWRHRMALKYIYYNVKIYLLSSGSRQKIVYQTPQVKSKGSNPVP